MFKNELLVKIPNSPRNNLNSMDWSQDINTGTCYNLWVVIFEYFKIKIFTHPTHKQIYAAVEIYAMLMPRTLHKAR
jgi:hypothetical protein